MYCPPSRFVHCISCPRIMILGILYNAIRLPKRLKKRRSNNHPMCYFTQPHSPYGMAQQGSRANGIIPQPVLPRSSSIASAKSGETTRPRRLPIPTIRLCSRRLAAPHLSWYRPAPKGGRDAMTEPHE